MITTICLIILVLAVLNKPVGKLLEKLKDVDWKALAQNAWSKIVTYSKKLGREVTRTLLRFYFTLTEGELTTLEKALVYAGIIYIAVPGDLLPRKVLSWIGVLDDVGVAAWIYNKIKSKITPDIELKVERTLDDWFGCEIAYVE